MTSQFQPPAEANFELGPYVNAAFIAENIIQDKEGVISAIRIIDRLVRTSHTAEPSPAMEPFEHEFYLLVILKSGENPGTYRVTVQPKKPSDETLPPFNSTVHLEAPADRGTNIVARMRLLFDVPGLWWFDVRINDKLVSRLYLRLIYLPQQADIHN